jgi:hypothetical protein
MHQGKGENNFHIRGLIQCGHRLLQIWGKKEKGMIGKAQWPVKVSLWPECLPNISNDCFAMVSAEGFLIFFSLEQFFSLTQVSLSFIYPRFEQNL